MWWTSRPGQWVGVLGSCGAYITIVKSFLTVKIEGYIRSDYPSEMDDMPSNSIFQIRDAAVVDNFK